MELKIDKKGIYYIITYKWIGKDGLEFIAQSNYIKNINNPQEVMDAFNSMVTVIFKLKDK